MEKSDQRMYVCKASAGTGKTYTLAAHYIALLMNDVPSKHILAVTFTNKATAEMKQRIITYLNAIANHCELKDTLDFLDCVRRVSTKVRNLNTFTNEQYSATAKKLLNHNMSNYDELNICTIDSFLQTLLTGLAQAIGQSAGFGVDLDITHAINTAVDEVLSIDVAEQSDVRKAVEKCLTERLNNEDKWDLRPNLIHLTQQLFKENVQEIHDCIPLVCNEHPEYSNLIEQYNKQLLAYKNNAEYKELEALYKKTCHYESDAVINGGKLYYSMIKRVGKSLAGENMDSSDFFRGMDTEALLKAGKKSQYKFVEEKFASNLSFGMEVRNQLLRMCELCTIVRPHYLKWKLCREYLNDLLLAGYVMERIHKDQHENNTVLLCQTAYTLYKALHKHDAQFILMKAGIRYQHIMLDEFQDTSSLQWINFRLLIEEIVSSINGSALIVGDVKQSIYRWRNGDYQIMNGLNQPQENSNLNKYYNEQRLSCNFRSRKQIVQFNLETFLQLSELEAQLNPEVKTMYEEGYVLNDEDKLKSFYRNGSKEGGFVLLRQYTGGKTHTENETAKQNMLEFMFDKMEELLSHGYQRKDMLILCRTSTESKQVLKMFYHLITDAQKYPNLRKAGKIISNDSFLLDSSVAVNTIVCALKLLVLGDKVAKEYLLINHPTMDIQALMSVSTSLPLVDIIEQIIRITLCPENKYTGSDIAHLNCLRDKIRSFISNYGSDIKSFLQYWDDKMHSDAIPATDSNDISIMTIHSSKGLQAKNIFIPFCSWKKESDGNLKDTLWYQTSDIRLNNTSDACLPVGFGKNMREVDILSSTYERERLKQRIDALNLLYVACTRAEDNLFILVNKNSSTGDSAGTWLTQLYGEERTWGTIHYADKQPVMDKQHNDKIPEPFSFESAPDITATYHSATSNIRFRQSLMAQQMMQRNEQLNDKNTNIAFGNLCHAILEKIQTAQDLERVVHDFYLRGNIPDEHCRKQIVQLINALLQHPIAGDWFNGTWTLLREDSVLAPLTSNNKITIDEYRMDRVMIKNQQVVVLDYKFGRAKDEYSDQVKNYMNIISKMGYPSVKGYLWYGFNQKLIEIV